MENEFTIQDDNDKLVFVIPRRANGLAVILTGLWILGYFIILLTVVYGQISDNRFIAELNVYIFLFALVWLMAIKMFLWNVRGKEKITLDNGLLSIERLGTLLTIPKKYETNLIDRFAVVENENWSIWTIYGFSGGQISFDYWGRPKYFGQTITKKQAREIVDKLNVRIKNYAQQNV
jgi:hypothetical protein